MIRSAPITVLAGALTLAAIAPPASAQGYVLRQGVSRDPATRVIQTRLSYSDLDLATAPGARELLHRIETAADAVCAGAKGDLDACRSAAISGAVARVASPALSALTGREQHAER